MNKTKANHLSRSRDLLTERKCIVCSSGSEYQFSKTILNKFDGRYFECRNCGLLFVDKPTWLQEAYTDAITGLDIGLIQRNIHYAKIVDTMILKHLPEAQRFLDYAGGYGMFVRLMRDMGHNFFRQDNYCANIFARHFDVQDLAASERSFDLVTAFEVFEHFAAPKEELRRILKFGNLILFSTELVPHEKNNLSSWWYLAPETGQHITFFTMRSLEALGASFGLKLYSNGKNLHLFAPVAFDKNPFPSLERHGRENRFRRLCLKAKLKAQQLGFMAKKKESLIASDYAAALDLLREHSPKPKTER